ncbi:MAG: IS110 family transposase [candidate division Zixibacteria bacterium]|nr:IS110 family transposase [candidate division Zixibacteria bacterium]MDH4035787.1 IS110 family transposase [candidate division Zixibacteria bacterium]
MAKSSIIVGIDLHKRSFDFVMMSSTGEIIKQGSRSTEASSVLEFASGLTLRHQAVLEPLENSYWFIEQLQPYAASVHLANSGKVRLIAESRLKNDRIDARILADLFRVGYLPEVYIPKREIHQWRCLIQHRIRLVCDRTRVKNRIIGLLNREGYRVAASDPFGKKGRAQIDSFELSSMLRQMVDRNLVSHDLLSSHISDLEAEIKQIVAADPIASNLCTIDGVAEFTALAIRAIVGRMDRFRSVKAFAAYTGLIPGSRQSADRVQHRPITKQGSTTLRWLLLQAAKHVVKKSGYFKRMHSRIVRRSSEKNARVVVAHALARIIYHVWMEARPYYR